MIRPWSSATAMPMWARWCTRMAWPLSWALTPGFLSRASATALMTMSVTETFGWPSSAFSRSRSAHASSIATSEVT